jgi:multiple sugar transport system substrate-binding protein
MRPHLQRRPLRRRLRLVAPLALVATAATALLAPGCTRSSEDRLRFMMWGSPDEIKVVQGYLDEFAVAHPEIPVVVEHAPDFGYQQKLQILVRGDNLPDVYYVRDGDLPWLVSQDALYDLTDMIERDRDEVEPDDFYPSVYEEFRHQGRMYGIAKDFATMVVYYNRDLFDKWDVPYPQTGWTWDDFLRTAQALSHPDEGDYGFLFETWPEELFPWIWAAGGDVASEDPPRWLMGDPEHIDASAEGLQFLSDLIWKHKVSPNPSQTRDQSGNALFVNGRVGMCTYGRWACMQFRHISRFDWDVIEMPRHPDRLDQPATSSFTVAYGVGARSQRVEDSWTLVKFLTNKQSQEAVAHSAQAIPSRRSVAESEAFLHPRALEGRDVAAQPHLELVDFGRFSPRFTTAPEAKAYFQRGVEPLWTGSNRDARALLEALQPELEAKVAGE